jgi:hypothetical protein
MELTIHTYGHIDAMYYVLNGIAMLTGGAFAGSLIKMICLLSAAYYGLMMAYSGSSGQHKQYLGKVFGMMMILNACLIPKTSMMIQDHVTKQRIKVDNLPYGFAVPVGILENFGDLLTGGFEQAFQVQNSISANYRDYGMVFGARLIQESRNWRINNPEFIENMDNFLRRCVIREAMMGIKYTPQDLLTSPDIWELVKTKLSHIRQVAIRSHNDRSLMTCAEARPVIEEAFKLETSGLLSRYRASEFASANSSEVFAPHASNGAAVHGVEAKESELDPRASRFLSANIQNAFRANIGANLSAETLMRQQMMINAMHNFSDDYGFARASATQESSWRLSGDLSTIYLPMLLTVMKGIFYASFIFLIPLMLLSGGMAKYMSFLSIVASLQLWPALNSVLNMFIDTYSTLSLSAISGNVISFSTASKVGDFTDKIVAVASGLQITVPFLAFGIIQGGVGGFINIAGTITGASQSAATSVAHEVTTGNRSLDNISMGNMQRAMQSGFKTDLNSSYAQGASSFQHMDGSQEKVLADGTMLMQSGMGMTTSGGAVKVNFRENAGVQVANAAAVNQSLLESDQRSYSVAERDTQSKAASYIAQIAKRESAGETFDYNKMGEQGQAVQQAVSYTKGVAAQNGYNYEQAASTTVSASAGGTLFGVGAKVSGDVSAKNYNAQHTTEDTGSKIDNSHQIKYDDIIRGSSSEQFATSNNLDTSYADDIKKSYEKQKSLEVSISARSEKAHQYSETLSRIESADMSMDRENYQQLQDNISREYGISGQEAHKWIESGDSRATGAYHGMVGEFMSSSHAAGVIEHAKQYTSHEESQRKLEDFSTAHSDKINHNPDTDIKQHAASQGFNTQNQAALVQNNTKGKIDALKNTNSDQIKGVKQEIDMEQKKASQELKQYEANKLPVLGK